MKMFKISGTTAVAAALLLTIQATAQTSSPTPLAGCVQKNGDIYTLVDENSKTKVQLRGGNLRAGQHIQVTGTADANASPAGGATQVLAVSGVQRTAGSCPSASRGSHHGKAYLLTIGIVGGLVVLEHYLTSTPCCKNR